MASLLDMLMGARPQRYYGTASEDQVNADASRAQQWAMNQADIGSRNYAADRDFWKAINQMMSDQNLAFQQAGYQRDLAGLNNQAALDRARLETDAQRYGYDQNLTGQMAGFATQRDVAGLNAATERDIANMNAELQRYTAGLNSQTGLQQTQMQTAAQMLPAQFQQDRFNTIAPIVTNLLGQYAGVPMQQPGGFGGMPGGFSGQPMFNPPAATSQPSGAAQPSGFDPNDYWHQQYARAVAEGRLPQGAPLPYSANSGQVENFLQKYVGGDRNATYTPPNQGTPTPAATPQVAPTGAPLNSMMGGYMGGDMPGMATGMSGGVSGQAAGSYGGLPTPPPGQAVGGDVVTPQMQNQMVNQALSQNARNYASQAGQAQSQLAGRGWNPRGPGMQYHNQIQNAQYNKSVADNQAYTQVPMQAAKMNADYRLGAAQTNTAQNAAFWNAYSQQQGNRNNQLGTLLGALTGLV